MHAISLCPVTSLHLACREKDAATSNRTASKETSLYQCWSLPVTRYACLESPSQHGVSLS